MMSEQIASSGIFYGDQKFPVPSHMNYGTLFLETIFKFGSKTALINASTQQQVTFAELAQLIVNTASSLTRLGLKPGDVAAICSENSIEYIITTIALFCAGVTATFINSAFTKDELIHTMKLSNPKYIFLSNNAFRTHNETLKSLNAIRKFFIYGDNVPSRTEAISFERLAKEFADMNSFRPENFYGRSQTALILYSSGTTGLPKGVKLTHVNLIATAYQEKASYSPQQSVLSVTPFCNTMGIFCVTDTLIIGKTHVFLSRFDEMSYLQTIEKYKVRTLIAAPPIVIILCKSSILNNYDLSSIKLINCGGAPLDPDLIKETKKRFPDLLHIIQGYGMTETTGAITRETETALKQGSVGKVGAGIILKIVDPESGKILGANQPGEVRVKGLALFDGYIRLGKPPQDDDYDEEGYFKTGDIAYYDEDGFIFIVDRIKELIKYKAWQVAPSELEAVLLQHKAVKDAGVIGTPDPAAGELPTAFVVKKAGFAVTEKELIDFVASKVSPWKRLRGGVRFVEAIPKNGSGKILRRVLRETLVNPPLSKL